jgi:hypothetical protein
MSIEGTKIPTTINFINRLSLLFLKGISEANFFRKTSLSKKPTFDAKS